MKREQIIVEIRLSEKGVENAARENDIIIVVDVLRASSTIITAIDNGALSIIPVLTVNQARKAAQIVSNSILGGERRALRIPDFLLGNSPLEYTSEVVQGKNIILTATNCTRILERCKRLQPCSDTLIGAFLNATSVAETAQRLGREKNRRISIIQAGIDGKPSQDDFVCAELIKTMIETRTSRHLSTALRDMAGLYIYAILSNTTHGKYLVKLGFGRDVDYCSRLDVTATVPRLSSVDRAYTGVVKLSSSTR